MGRSNKPKEMRQMGTIIDFDIRTRGVIKVLIDHRDILSIIENIEKTAEEKKHKPPDTKAFKRYLKSSMGNYTFNAVIGNQKLRLEEIDIFKEGEEKAKKRVELEERQEKFREEQEITENY
jgi:hypothetical protein